MQLIQRTDLCLVVEWCFENVSRLTSVVKAFKNSKLWPHCRKRQRGTRSSSETFSPQIGTLSSVKPYWETTRLEAKPRAKAADVGALSVAPTLKVTKLFFRECVCVCAISIGRQMKTRTRRLPIHGGILERWIVGWLAGRKRWKTRAARPCEDTGSLGKEGFPVVFKGGILMRRRCCALRGCWYLRKPLAHHLVICRQCVFVSYCVCRRVSWSLSTVTLFCFSSFWLFFVAMKQSVSHEIPFVDTAVSPLPRVFFFFHARWIKDKEGISAQKHIRPFCPL